MEVVAVASRLLGTESDESDRQGRRVAGGYPGELNHRSDTRGVVLGTRRLRDRVQVSTDDDVRLGRVEAWWVGNNVRRRSFGHVHTPRDTGRDRDIDLGHCVAVSGEGVADF